MLEVKVSGVDKEYRYQGIMASLYITIVRDLGYDLMSDSEWSNDAEKLWKNS